MIFSLSTHTQIDLHDPQPARLWLQIVLVIAVGLLAYGNSLPGVFVFDDMDAIVHNRSIRTLWPIWDAAWSARDTTAAGRPVVNYSLALNYAMGGLSVWIYHLTNICVHLLVALALLGLFRRIFRLPQLAQPLGGCVSSIPLVVCLLWVAHPLTSESVTYIIHRAESMVSLFVVLTLYCAMRVHDSQTRKSRVVWSILCVVACYLGVGCKELMVVTPLLVALLFGVFFGSTYREGFCKHRILLAALASSWIGWALIIATVPRGLSVGFGLGTSALGYFTTQWGVILHYLRLGLWPDDLCLSYAWPIAQELSQILWPGLVLFLLAGLTLWALVRRSAWGYLGACFFLILGPSSSFVPIVTEVASEHRMYLPLVCLITAVVVVTYVGIKWIATRWEFSLPSWFAKLGFVLLLVLLVGLTAHRNTQYHNELTIWQDALECNAQNTRALHSVGFFHQRKGDLSKALSYYVRLLEIDEQFSQTLNNLAVVKLEQGQPDEAIVLLNRLIKSESTNPSAFCNLGIAYHQKGDFARSIQAFQQGVASPYDIHKNECYYGLGLVLRESGTTADRLRAIEAFQKAIEYQLNPDFAAHVQLAELYMMSHRAAKARFHAQQATDIQPEAIRAKKVLEKLQSE